MTKEDYLKLLETSEVFAEFGIKLQDKFSAASGEQIDQFAQILSDGEANLQEAKLELAQKNGSAISIMKHEIHTVQRNKLNDDEGVATIEDKKNSEKLIANLKNL